MLEPVSALGIAAATVQFIDFVGRLITSTAAIYRSNDGSQGSLEGIVGSLTKLNDDLIKSTNSPVANSTNTRDADVVRLCKECNQVARSLISTLDGLDHDSSMDLWGSFVQALKARWSDRQVQALKDTLNAQRSQSSMCILVSLRYVCYT